MNTNKDFLTFEVNWATKFGFALDRDRLMAELWELNRLKDKQLEALRERRKKR